MFGPNPTPCAGGEYRSDDKGGYWADKRTLGLIAAIGVLAVALALTVAKLAM